MTASRPADSPALLRRLNSAVVFRSVRANGPVSRADLGGVRLALRRGQQMLFDLVVVEHT
jgi:hypothetical protein